MEVWRCGALGGVTSGGFFLFSFFDSCQCSLQVIHVRNAKVSMFAFCEVVQIIGAGNCSMNTIFAINISWGMPDAIVAHRISMMFFSPKRGDHGGKVEPAEVEDPIPSR